MKKLYLKKLWPASASVGPAAGEAISLPAAKKKAKSGGLSAKGQSLVEMAIIAPLLIFFLIGIFEVGWALRNYLVLVNVNREITRYAIRPGYLNFSTVPDIQLSYNRVKDWALSSVSGQLNIDFDTPDASTSLIISHAVIDTGRPCDAADLAACECNRFDPDDAAYDPDYNPFPYDDLIIHPDLPGYEYQRELFGPATTTTGPRNSRIDFSTLAPTLAAKNNEFNCEIMKKNGVPSANNVVITEMFHDQPQLFGFPFISNPYTDPVPLYSHTTMRLIGAARSPGGVEGSLIAGIDTIGPICLVYPMLIREADVHPTDSKNIIQHGWLKWGDLTTDDIADDEDYLEFALLYPQMSLNDYDQPGGIQTEGTVDRVTGTFTELADELDVLVGQRIIIPTTTEPSPGNPVTISGFTWATIESFNLASDEVLARFDTVTPLPAACN